MNLKHEKFSCFFVVIVVFFLSHMGLLFLFCLFVCFCVLFLYFFILFLFLVLFWFEFFVVFFFNFDQVCV